MRKSIPLFIAVLTLMVLTSSTCKKPLVCTGDCYDLNILGTTQSVVTGSPVGNVPMTLYRGNQGSLISIRRKVVDFESDASGRINSSASIDTSVLRSHYYFWIGLRDNPKWVIAEDDYNALYDVTQSPFDNYQLKVYERKDLVLKLQKVLPGNFTSFSVSCYYGNVRGIYAWNISQPQELRDITKVVAMASGLWAHIDVARSDANGNSTFTRDSVMMPAGAGQAPTFIVKY